jgi:CHASE2 domain-containing sensor protein
MAWRWHPKKLLHWRSGVIAMALTVLFGLIAWMSPAGNILVRLSYDLLFLFKAPASPSSTVIVGLDEKSYREKNVPLGQIWPRSLHARFLDKLTADRARMVVFDVWFNDPGQADEDRDLSRAMRENGRVVLAGILSPLSQPGLAGNSTLPPRDEFLTNAAAWGISGVWKDPDTLIRRLYPGTEDDPSLVWAAARLAGAAVTEDPRNRWEERWLNYYGPPGSIRRISYVEASREPPGYFENKIVIVGARPQTGVTGEEKDEFPTPYTWYDSKFAGGVEIIATSLLNLIEGDWLRRMPALAEGLILILGGALLGAGLNRFRPLPALTLAVGGFVGVALAAVVLVWTTHVWFDWLAVAAVEVPCAWICSLLAHHKRVANETAFLQRTLSETMSEIKKAAPVSSAGSAGGTPPIPDHALVRRVGRGAYGEVWLARNAIGIYHAVKIVHRDSFADSAPYEREFKGIQKYMPVSFSHPGLVHILHVGRNEPEGYFFYIMEAGDDEVTGQRIDPQTYSPRTLATELQRRRFLPADQCLTLMVALTAALDHLHRQKLVHRDIKPSNIIYLDGVPKFADIGLVTDLATMDKQVSLVGTKGYIPPEGPGTAAADVYSLGKVLYQACAGLDPDLFPELPTDFADRLDYAVFKHLNLIVGRACDWSVDRRYRSAVEMHADLLRLQFRVKEEGLSPG